jgi:hypothetical protein
MGFDVTLKVDSNHVSRWTRIGYAIVTLVGHARRDSRAA